MATVREATFEVMRRHGMTRIFGNPGSTEVPFLTDLPDDIEFVMGLHESAVVGMATGYALATGEPQFVNLHTAPGLGNAVNAIANARDGHAPLVIVVGQQDRRQLPVSPFLFGRELEQLAGPYPVWKQLPLRPQDLPGAIARAHGEALAAGGPALVVAPMGDWAEDCDPIPAGAPARVILPSDVSPSQLDPLVELLAEASAPAIVTGAGTDSVEGFAAVVALCERLSCPVWHEPFSARAGFPEDHPLFAGHLDWQRRRMRETLAGFDVVLVVGTKAFQLYVLDEERPPVVEGTRVAVVTAFADEALQSACELAVVGPVAAVLAELAARVPARAGGADAAGGAGGGAGGAGAGVGGAGGGAGGAGGGAGGAGAGAAGANGGAGGAGAEGTDGLPLFRRPGAPEPATDGDRLRSAHVLALLAEQLPADAVLVEESPSCRPELLERIPTRMPLGFVSNANGGLGCPAVRIETHEELDVAITEALGRLRDATAPLLLEVLVAP